MNNPIIAAYFLGEFEPAMLLEKHLWFVMCLRAVYHEHVKTLVLHLIWTKTPVSPPTCAEAALLQKNIRECISR